MSDLPQPKTMEECLTMQSHFVGIPKITKNNSEEFFRRGKNFTSIGDGVLERRSNAIVRRCTESC